MDIKKIGLRIKGLRAENGLKQEDLAKELGVNRSTISKIERGENAPTAKELIELKRIFNVSIDWILTGQGSRDSKGLPGDLDEDLIEMFEDLKDNQPAQIAVLSYFYTYKAKHLKKFVKPSEKIKVKKRKVKARK